MGSIFRRRSSEPAQSDGWTDDQDDSSGPEARANAFLAAQKSRQQGDLEKAQHQLRDLLAERPDDIECLRALASVYQERGFRRDAILIYNKLLGLNPADAEAKQSLSDLMKTG